MKLVKSVGSLIAVVVVLTVTLPTLPATPPAFAVTGTTGVSPSSGSSQGGVAVTIVGTDFQPGTCTAGEMTGVTTVGFNNTPGTPPVGAATSVVVVNDTTITAMAPSGPSGGTATVTITQGVPASACTAFATTVTGGAYSYLTPAMTGITPASGPGGTPISVTGINLHGTDSVTIGGVPATGVVVNSAGTMVNATAGPSGAGTAVVCVDNAADGNPAVCGPVTFTYTVPTFTPTAAPTRTPTVTVTPTTVPTPVGGVAVTGTVVGVAPAGFRSPASNPPGAHLVPTAHVVMIDQVSGAGFGTHTAFNGNFSLSVPPGTYRMSIADNDDDSGQTDCALVAGAACGHILFQQLVSTSAIMP